MKDKPELLYLALLKKTLTFTLWPEPPIPITAIRHKYNPVNWFFVTAIAKLLKLGKLQIVKDRGYSEEMRTDGGIWPVYADTMIGMKRLDNIQYCVETVIKDGVQGDFIETGVWRGGACILMRAILKVHGVENRRVFVADSFAGLPKPDAEKYPADKGDKHHTRSFLTVTKKDVENNFKKYGLLDNQVVFLKGWFKDTLPKAPIKKLSILRLDGDMYGSTMEALEILYPKLSRGGFCIIDDYALRGCKMAVDDYRSKYNIKEEMKAIDWTGRYWRKD
jgi:hypothetical protein